MESRRDEAQFALQDDEIEQAFLGVAKRFNPRAAAQNQFFIEDKGKRYEFVVVEKAGKKFVFCPLTKDAQSPDNEAHLLYVIEMLMKFCSKYKGSNYTLLFPMRLCRGHLHLPVVLPLVKNSHYILGELDLDSLFLRFHDAQPNTYAAYVYADKFKDVTTLNGRRFVYDPQRHYNYYGQLGGTDYHLAAYYVIEYARVIASNAEPCAKFKLDLAGVTHKQEYLNRYAPLNADAGNLSIYLAQSLFQPETKKTLDGYASQGLTIAV